MMKVKKNKKLLAILLTTVMSLAALTGCGESPVESETGSESQVSATAEAPAATESASQEEVTINFWHHYSAQSAENETLMNVLIPEFEKENPGIKVNAVSHEWADLHQKILISAQSNTLPDVARLDSAWVPEFEKMGILTALDEEMSDFNDVSGGLLESAMSTAKVDGHFYGLALNTNTKILFYNVQAFKDAGIEAPKTMDEFVDAVGDNNYKSLLLRQYMTIDIFYGAQEFFKGLHVSTEELAPEFGDIKYIPKIAGSVEETMHYLKKLFETALSERDKVSGNRYGSLIDTAKQYLKEHFESNEISLNTVAAEVGVSSSYFSSIFKQETGQSFVEYLTKLRIDKACELLRCTTLRSAEIGERVGYNDPHYFSATFKKVTGVSPKDYKNGSQEPERRDV